MNPLFGAVEQGQIAGDEILQTPRARRHGFGFEFGIVEQRLGIGLVENIHDRPP
jgi:hypothetical protein